MPNFKSNRRSFLAGLPALGFISVQAADSPPLLATPGNEYPLIRTKPSLSARLENILTSVLTKLDGTSNAINSILSAENQAAFKSALADIATVARTIADLAGAADLAEVCGTMSALDIQHEWLAAARQHRRSDRGRCETAMPVWPCQSPRVGCGRGAGCAFGRLLHALFLSSTCALPYRKMNFSAMKSATV